jgi:hypothetical protein
MATERSCNVEHDEILGDDGKFSEDGEQGVAMEMMALVVTDEFPVEVGYTTVSISFCCYVRALTQPDHQQDPRRQRGRSRVALPLASRLLRHNPSFQTPLCHLWNTSSHQRKLALSIHRPVSQTSRRFRQECTEPDEPSRQTVLHHSPAGGVRA